MFLIENIVKHDHHYAYNNQFPSPFKPHLWINKVNYLQ